jgi:hypothetical protein
VAAFFLVVRKEGRHYTEKSYEKRWYRSKRSADFSRGVQAPIISAKKRCLEDKTFFNFKGIQRKIDKNQSVTKRVNGKGISHWQLAEIRRKTKDIRAKRHAHNVSNQGDERKVFFLPLFSRLLAPVQ